MYFDEFSTLPGRVSIPRLQSQEEETLNAGERTALALLRLAGVATEDFAEEDYEARKAALEAASNEMTSEVFEFWSQNEDLLVEFDLDYKVRPGEPADQVPYLEIRIGYMCHRRLRHESADDAGTCWPGLVSCCCVKKASGGFDAPS